MKFLRLVVALAFALLFTAAPAADVGAASAGGGRLRTSVRAAAASGGWDDPNKRMCWKCIVCPEGNGSCPKPLHYEYLETRSWSECVRVADYLCGF